MAKRCEAAKEEEAYTYKSARLRLSMARCGAFISAAYGARHTAKSIRAIERNDIGLGGGRGSGEKISASKNSVAKARPHAKYARISMARGAAAAASRIYLW